MHRCMLWLLHNIMYNYNMTLKFQKLQIGPTLNLLIHSEEIER